MSELKQCNKCSLWIKPLSNSACNIKAVKPLRFKKNFKGMYYCDDFKLEKRG